MKKIFILLIFLILYISKYSIASERDVYQEDGILSSECEDLFKYWHDKEGALY